MPYTPPDSKLVEILFAGAYTPPDSRMIGVDLIPPPTGSTQVVYPNAIGDYGAGAPSVQNTARALYPTGFDTAAFGTLATANLSQGVTTTGTAHAAYGAPEKVWNFHTFVRDVGVGIYTNQQTHTVRNQHEYLHPGGINSLVLGGTITEREDRGRHILRYVDYFDEAGASPSGGVADFGFHTTDYVFRIADYTNEGSPRAYYMHRYDRQTWATDGTPRYTEDPTTGDFFYPEVSAGFVSLNGSVYLACRARRSDDSLYHAILQLDSAGEYVASVDTGLGVNDYIYAITAVGNRIYFCTRTALYEGTGLVVSPVTSGSFFTLRGNTTGLFSLALDRTVTRHDLNTGGVLVSVTTDASVLAVTDHVVWVISGDATARAYDLALAPLSEVSIAMFAPQEGVADIKIVPRVSVSANLVAVSTSQSFVLLYGEAERQTIAGYFPVAHGGLVPSTVYEYNDASLEYYSPPPDYMYIPASPWPPETAVPAAVDLASYTRRQAFDALQLLSDTEAYLTMNDVFVVPHSGAGYLPPGWRVRKRAIIKASVHVSTAGSLVLAPEGVSTLATGAPSIRMQWQVVVPASAKHSVVNEVAFQLKNRQVFPRDVFDTSFGIPVVRSNLLAPAGFDSLVVPLPDVTDRHQDIYPQSVPPDAIMGDPPRVWNYTRYIIPDSTDHGQFPNFQPTVDNFNKEAHPVGYAATRWGTSQIANKAVALQMVGLDATLFGNSDTTNWFQYRATTGTDLSLFGTAEVVNAQLVAHPVGADTATIGDAEISLKHRTLLIDGIDPPQPSDDLWVSPSPRIFGRFGGVDASSVSQPDVSHGVRYLLPQPFLPAVFGSLRTGLTVREISPAGIFFQTPAAAFGPPRVADAIQIISAAGTDGATVSSIDIARNEVVLAQITLGTQTVLGTTQVELSRRVVRTIGAAHDYFGEPNAWNWCTYVAARPPLISDIFGAVSAELRNKLLHPVGFDTGRVSAYVDASNNARLVAPAGDDLSQFGTSLVADRVRSIVTAGEDTGRVSIWATTYNMRKIVEPASFSRTRYGVPYIWRNERFVTVGSCGDSEMFGDAMVADRIRTVTQYRYADPMMGFPTVALYTQYVSPQGFAERFGDVTLTHFRNEAHIFGSNYMRFGAPETRNFNPQAWVDGIGAPISTEKPWLSFRVRPIDLSGWAIGDYAPARPVVEFRTRTVLPVGYAMDTLPRTHDIRFDMPQVAAEQRVLPWGIEKPAPSLPSITSNVLFPDGEDAAKFGRIYIAGNEFAQNSALCDFAKVSDLTISHRDQRIYVNSAEKPLVFKPSDVSLSPITVGPFGDVDPTLLIDFKLVTDSTDAFARPFFGYPTASNYSRAAQVSGRNHLDVGIPEVRTNYLYPEGWDSNEAKFGMTDFAGPQYIEPYWGRLTADYIPEVEEYNFDTALYGEVNAHAYAPPPVWNPYRDITGSNMQLFGMLNIENFNRAVYPDGSEVDRFGFVWLHPPFRLLPEGITPPDITIEQVAFRIREVYPTGDEHAVVCQEEAETIAGRMRVRHGTSRYAVDSITPPPITGTEISHRIRTINTSGVDFGQARIVRISRLRGENTCRPSGADSSVFGTPSKVIEGQITPYAPDMQQLGTVRTARRLYCWGVPPNEPSDIRAGRLVYPNGAGSDIFDGPSITNPYGCRNRVITVSAGDNFSTFGGAHATN